MCPYCQHSQRIVKRGTYTLSTSPKRIQRYFCLHCNRGFSQQTTSFDYRLRKRKHEQNIFRMLSKGCSQRGCAQILGFTPRTIARRVQRFGQFSQSKLEWARKNGPKCIGIMVDEMESFEHTKLKPLTIPIAIEKENRKILALEVGQIAAKGHLAEKSRKKYGPRKCERKQVLTKFFQDIKGLFADNGRIISDESPHYLPFIRTTLKGMTHERHKGGRGAVVGQGELKKKAFDPLFQLNHSYAMIRDNIKRLSRRTWCTTKLIERLKNLLYIYANYHNQILDGHARPRIENISN